MDDDSKTVLSVSANDGSNLTDVTQNQIDTLNIYFQSPIFDHYQHAREFTTLINERTRGFLGRDFIFQGINQLLQDQSFPSGYILVYGEPGIGKTSLFAKLVAQNEYISHFNIAAQNIRSTEDFLYDICAQLILRYELNYDNIPVGAGKDSGFLSHLLNEAAHKQPNKPLVIVVDALDEADDAGLPPMANTLLLPSTLPQKVYFIVSSRPSADYRLVVDARKDIFLSDSDPRNLEDIRQYISAFLNTHNLEMLAALTNNGISADDLCQALTEKSEGNFMYLVHVLRDIRDGHMPLSGSNSLALLPQGLKAYYQQHWRTMRAVDPEKFEKYYQKVICILACASEPITTTKIMERSKLSSSQVRAALDCWRAFLNIDQPPGKEARYRIYHNSFQDFLREDVGLKPYYHMTSQSILETFRKIFNRKPQDWKERWK